LRKHRCEPHGDLGVSEPSPVPDVEESTTGPADLPTAPDDEPQLPEPGTPQAPDANGDVPVEEPQPDAGNGEAVQRQTDSDSQAMQEEPAVQGTQGVAAGPSQGR
jgi:hypothetical protein